MQSESPAGASSVFVGAASVPSRPRMTTRSRGRMRMESGEFVPINTRRIDAVVLTLDDVLYDHTGMLGHLAIGRAVRQLVAENVFESEDSAFEALQTFRNAFGYRKRFPRFIDSLLTAEKISVRSAERVIKAYYESQIPESRTIRPFEKAQETLKELQSGGYALGLLLIGKSDVQLERLKTLQLEKWFSHIVLVPSNPSLSQVSAAMKEMGRKLMLQPSSVLFVGRKVFFEIKAANKLGFMTARMLHGKYANVMPIEAFEQPDFQIEWIEELTAVVKLANQRIIRPKIVAIGGGTGLAVLLKELRAYPADLTAIVTVFDSGRHSGALRKKLGILPPGDIRNCLVALSDSDVLLNKMMNYRFKENFMEGCSLGNLLLAAMTDIQGGFDKAVTSLSDILNIHGNVFPATLDDTELCAELEDGTIVVSEVNVRSPVYIDQDGLERKKPRIKRVFLQKEEVAAFLPAVKAIENADVIVLSPGGFYTSIIAPLLVPGIRDAINRSGGTTVYISNVTTQCGQTDGYTLSETLEVLHTYLGKDSIDYIIANNAVLPPELMESFCSRGETLLLPTQDLVEQHHPTLLQGKTFEDEDLEGIKEWNKAPMIRHSGKVVVSMLYRIIDKEIQSIRANHAQVINHHRHDSLPRSVLIPSPRSPRRHNSSRAKSGRPRITTSPIRPKKHALPLLMGAGLALVIALASIVRKRSTGTR